MTEPLVELRDVDKRYSGLQALSDISLTIAPGEVLGLFGHNGAGKSTLMKLILGVIEPSAGEVLALGHSPTGNDSHHYRRQFGYLPENVSFYDQLSGREVLRYFAKLKGLAKSEADRLLQQVGLADACDRAVKGYSKGMRQRLGLAQALLGEPRLLLLDEPTVGLDPVATRDFYQTVDELKSGGCSVILCSHVLPGVESHIDRAMILSGGRQRALGSLEQLTRDAALPVEIISRGVDSAAPALQGIQHTLRERRADGSLRWSVPVAEKLSAMASLLACPELSDIELRQPTLDELYRHYLADTLKAPVAAVAQPCAQHASEELAHG